MKTVDRRLNTIGNYLLTWLTNLLYGTRISDVSHRILGISRNVIKDISLTSDGFQLEAEFLTSFEKKVMTSVRFRFLTVRREGKAKLSGLKDGIRIGRS